MIQDQFLKGLLFLILQTEQIAATDWQYRTLNYNSSFRYSPRLAENHSNERNLPEEVKLELTIEGG